MLKGFLRADITSRAAANLARTRDALPSDDFRRRLNQIHGFKPQSPDLALFRRRWSRSGFGGARRVSEESGPAACKPGCLSVGSETTAAELPGRGKSVSAAWQRS